MAALHQADSRQSGFRVSLGSSPKHALLAPLCQQLAILVQGLCCLGLKAAVMATSYSALSDVATGWRLPRRYLKKPNPG